MHQVQESQIPTPNTTSKKSCFTKRKKSIIITLLVLLAIIAAVLLLLFLYVLPKQRKVMVPELNYNDPSLFDDSKSPNQNIPPIKDPFLYGKIPIRGINIGGWLLLEPFITPSLFEQFKPEQKVIDEYTFCSTLGRDECRRQLEKHYDTWVTEDTFKRIASMGLDHVRIPIGYWAVDTFPDDPYINGTSWNFLLRGINWARKYGIRVMIELHGAPGSQNGWNHSGRSGTIQWLNGTEGNANADRTLTILKRMADFFSDDRWNRVVPIFGILNEPAIFNLDQQTVKNWYFKAYDVVKSSYKPETTPLIVIHEGFVGLDKFAGFMPPSTYPYASIDVHNYLIFNKDLIKLPKDQQINVPCGGWRDQVAQSEKAFGKTMVGEFSVATNDCGKWLNGVGLGSRYDGTYMANEPACPTCSCKGVDDWKSFTPEYKKFLLVFVEKQMSAFEAGIGWFFWNFKTENGVNPHWDYFLGVDQGWIPKDSSIRQYSC